MEEYRSGEAGLFDRLVTRSWLRASFVGLLMGVAACNPPDQGTAEVSGGVGNTRQVIEAARQLRVADVPMLRIGVLEGPEELQFLRIADVKLASERIHVLDERSCTVHVFDRSGQHVASFGRRGEGPGEFIYPSSLVVLGDSIVGVWDRQLQRLTLFSASGEVVHTAQVSEDMANPFLRAVFRDGSFLIADIRPAFTVEGSEASGSIHAVRYSHDGTLLDTLAALKHVTMVRVGREVGTKPFAGTDYVESDGETVWLVRGDSALAVGIATTGDTLRVIGWQPPDRVVTEQDIETHFAQALEGAHNSVRGAIEGIRDAGIAAEYFPAARGLLIDQTGRPWVRDLTRPSEQSSGMWIVFTPNGDVGMTVSVPEEGLKIYDTDGEYVATVERDELGVQRVALYALEPLEGS